MEADSVEQSEHAMANELQAQITAADRTLKAELTKLDRTVDSAIIIAQANYDEAMARAHVFSRKTDVEVVRLKARNEMAGAVAAAEIEHNRNLIFSNSLRAEADIDRLLASAHSDREHAEAMADAHQAAIAADSHVARAQANAHRQIASARTDAVEALFNARIVQADSARIRADTDRFREILHRRTNLEAAFAQAESARAASRTRLAELRKHQHLLQETALKNWDARLAGLKYYDPANKAKPGIPASDITIEALPASEVVEVPTDRDP